MSKMSAIRLATALIASGAVSSAAFAMSLRDATVDATIARQIELTTNFPIASPTHVASAPGAPAANARALSDSWIALSATRESQFSGSPAR